MGMMDAIDSDHDGNVLDDLGGDAALGIGALVGGAGAVEEKIGLGLMGAGIKGAASTGGLAGLPGGLMAAGGAGMAVQGAVVGGIGDLYSGPGVDLAEEAGDFVGGLLGFGTPVAPGTPAGPPSLQDAMPPTIDGPTTP